MYKERYDELIRFFYSENLISLEEDLDNYKIF